MPGSFQGDSNVLFFLTWIEKGNIEQETERVWDSSLYEACSDLHCLCHGAVCLQISYNAQLDVSVGL